MANVVLKLSSLNSTPIKRDYLYRDMNSDIALNSNKTDVVTNDNVYAIFGSLKNIFDYMPGQRILNPLFGLNFNSLLYEPMSEKTAKAIGMIIYNGLKDWETRISVNSIDIKPDYDDHTYYLDISFKIHGLGDKNYFFTYEIRQKL